MLADHIHATSFLTVAGELTFGKDGDGKSRASWSFRNITGNDPSQFRDTTRQVTCGRRNTAPARSSIRIRTRRRNSSCGSKN
jgi:hypothetical protein